ncbi:MULTISPECIES: GspH/FimT family pseudopilin [unclassified Ketobacter]|uniref:GspH/FimT family pseudopilin n=1 Tax=unclassified Ketobacter TaxID=2639109 RepID=UPI0025BBE840|nr:MULTISPECIES: GspH/FimT family pseudopilin [unclassified Ketobacter]
MQRAEKGFTIVELMITLVIVAIMIAFATPSFIDMIEKNRVRTTGENLLELLRTSRLTAVQQRSTVVVCGSSNRETCDNDWQSSIITVKPAENDGQDQILASMSISDKVTISKTNNGPINTNIDFNSNGWSPFDNTIITLCPVDGKQRNAYQVTLSGSGKTKIRSNTQDENWC